MPTDIADSINHFIEIHGYHLLHVGTQTSHSREGGLSHATVAVLGRTNPSVPDINAPEGSQQEK